MRNMCVRLSAILDAMRASDSEISRMLRYTNPATIARMRKGETFFDSERLALLGTLAIDGTITANLHWILTGNGEPVISTADKNYAKALSLLILKNAENSPLND